MNNTIYCKVEYTPCWGTLGIGEAYMVEFIDDNGKGHFAINIGNNKDFKSWARHVGSLPTNETIENAIHILKERGKLV